MRQTLGYGTHRGPRLFPCFQLNHPINNDADLSFNQFFVLLPELPSIMLIENTVKFLNCWQSTRQRRSLSDHINLCHRSVSPQDCERPVSVKALKRLWLQTTLNHSYQSNPVNSNTRSVELPDR